ncbi:MAG TPA: endonuclease/exonuclease/phosphatase family protein [Ktedonobacterales bacterium]|nr:endonuclease/exonuclease/phosphatase family protein [Ktedonobacterales bacterium]
MALRVMTYNILKGGGERIPYIRDVIRGQSPDAIAIQEANDRDLIESLARELEMRLVYGEANSAYHMAWLTSLPIRRSENHRLPELRKTLLELEVEWAGQPLRLYNIHLKANPEGESQRMEEIQAILRVVGPASAEPRLLVGDLNSIGPHDRYIGDIQFPDEDVAFAERAYRLPRQVIPAVLAAGYVDIYRALRPESEGYTAKTPTPVVRLDYIFASPTLAARAVSCDRVEGSLPVYTSDHLPVRADFE